MKSLHLFWFWCHSIVCLALLSTASARKLVKREGAFKPTMKEQINRKLTCPKQQPHHQEAAFLLRQIYRVENITLEEFREFAKDEVAVPLIIENPSFDASAWTADSFLEECGHIPIRIPNYVENCETYDTCHSVKEKADERQERWAGMDYANVDKHKLKTLGDLIRAQRTPSGAGLYLHDAPLSHYCPPKLDSLRIPKYFPRNYDILRWDPKSANMTFVESEYQWPSIFMSRKGTGSGLHSDSHMTRFWTKMLAGEKLWRLIPPSEHWRMYPSIDSLAMASYPHKFHVDVINPDFARYPDMNGALVYEAVLKPGDVLFSPAAWGHQVVNAKDAVMTSLNYYDNEVMTAVKKYAKNVNDVSITSDAWDAFFMPLDDPEFKDDISLDVYVRSQHLMNAEVPVRVKHWIDTTPQMVKDYRNEGGLTALQVATLFNFSNLIRYLLENCDGLNVNEVDDVGGFTALDIAINSKFDEVIKLLKEHGATDFYADSSDDEDSSDDG